MQVLFWIVTLLLLGAAATLGVMAWRMARGERQRESARVQLLKALAFPDGAVLASGPSNSDLTPEFMSEEDPAFAADAYEPASSIFSEPEKPLTTVPRWRIALFAGAAALALIVVLHARLAGERDSATVSTASVLAGPAPAETQTAAAVDSPVELIALQHRFTDANVFDVSGEIRNPATNRALSELTANITLLDGDGHIITSQTTPLERPTIAPGQTAAFSLAFPRVGTIASYEVTFHARSGDTILHVDHRAPRQAAKVPAF